MTFYQLILCSKFKHMCNNLRIYVKFLFMQLNKECYKIIISQQIINNTLIYLKTKLFENCTRLFYFTIDVYVLFAYSIL